LLQKGLIEKNALFTIRQGELIRDPVAGQLRPSPEEMIKIRERESGGCIFYDEAGKACTIYKHRPIQCVALKCWDPGEFMAVYRGPKLARRDVVEDGLLLGLIASHEKRCHYETMKGHVSRIEREGEKAVQRIIDLLKLDYNLRPFVSEKTGVALDEMDFLFGRPLIETMAMFGLKVIRKPDGTFFLTKVEGCAHPVR
jgi:hypothetical protein